MTDPLSRLRAMSHPGWKSPLEELRSLGSIGAWEATESPNVQRRRRPDGTYEYRPNPAGFEGAPGVEHKADPSLLADREAMLSEALHGEHQLPKSGGREILDQLAPRVAANVASLPEVPSMAAGLLDRGMGRDHSAIPAGSGARIAAEMTGGPDPGAIDLSLAAALSPRRFYSDSANAAIDKIHEKRAEVQDRLAEGMTNAGFSPVASALADTGLEVAAMQLDPTNVLPIIGGVHGAKGLRSAEALANMPDAMLSREMSVARQLPEDRALASFPNQHPMLELEARTARHSLLDKPEVLRQFDEVSNLDLGSSGPMGNGRFAGLNEALLKARERDGVITPHEAQGLRRGAPKAPPLLRPRPVRWSPSPAEAIRDFADYALERGGAGTILPVEDVPFELRDLPITRWEGNAAPGETARNGEYWMLGESIRYAGKQGGELTGGRNLRFELYTPQNPLVIVNKDHVASLPGVGLDKTEKAGFRQDKALADYARLNGHDAVVHLNVEDGPFPAGQRPMYVEVIKMDPAHRGRPLPLTPYLQAAVDHASLLGTEARENLMDLTATTITGRPFSHWRLSREEALARMEPGSTIAAREASLLADAAHTRRDLGPLASGLLAEHGGFARLFPPEAVERVGGAAVGRKRGYPMTDAWEAGLLRKGLPIDAEELRFSRFLEDRGHNPADLHWADEAALRREWQVAESAKPVDLRPDIVPDGKARVFRVGDAEFDQAWKAEAYRDALDPATGHPPPALTRERWEQLRAGQSDQTAGRIKAAKEALDRPVAPPDAVAQPRVGVQAAEVYSGQRAGIEAQIKAGVDQGLIQPEQVNDLRAQNLRALDAGWHEKFSAAARQSDDPTLAMLADETEDATVQPLEAPPLRPDGIGPGGRFKPSESGHVTVPHWNPQPPRPEDAVIRYGPDPKLPVRQRIRNVADGFIDKYSNKEEAGPRLLRRAGLKNEARELEMYIGKRRGAARTAANVVKKGVKIWDPVKQKAVRIYDSFESIVGGLDGQAYRDLNNLMAAQHHMELVARQERAALEFDMARARRLEEMRQARQADKQSLQSMAGGIRDARLKELQAARAESKAKGSYAAFVVSENRARAAGSRRALLSPMEKSSDAAAGRLSAGQQGLEAAPDPRTAINSARRVAMGIRDEATNFRKRFPPVEAPPDLRLDIHPDGTAISQGILSDIQQRYGVDPATGEVNRLGYIANRIREWSNAAIIEQLDSVGFFSPDRKAAVLAKNKEYAPFLRLLDELADDPNILAGGSTSNPIKKISGGLSPDHPIAPPLESFVAHAQRIALWVEKQRVKNLLGDFAEAHPIEVGREIKKVNAAQASNAFQVFRDGQRHLYSAPLDVLKAIDNLTPPQANIFMQAGVVAARMLRAGATLTLDFALRNFLRDQATAGVYGAEFHYRPFTDFFVGMWAQTPFASAQLREVVERLESAGYGMADYINLERPQVQLKAHAAAGLVKLPGGRLVRALGLPEHKLVRAPLLAHVAADWAAEKNVFAKIMYPVLRPLEGFSGSVELGTRIGAGRRAMLGGATDLEAANYARNITLDFGRVGSAVQRWNSVEAFANANLQDVARFSKAMRERPIATMLSAGAYVTIPALAVYWGHKDDPAYTGLPEYERANFLHVEKVDKWGRWFRVPRPQGLMNLLFGYGVTKMLQAANDELGPHPVNELLSTIFNETPLRYSPVQPDPHGGVQGSLEFLPTAVQPAVEVAAGDSGWSSYRQGPIVPQGLVEGAVPEERSLDSTSATARWLGQKTGIAPLKIDYLIRGYGAGLTTTIMRGIEKATGAGTADLPELPSSAKDYPGVGGLVSASPYGFASQPVQDLYALEKQAAAAKKSLGDAEDQGRVKDYQRILKEHPEVRFADELTEAKNELNDIRKEHREVRVAPGLEMERRSDMLLQRAMAATQIAATRMHWVTDMLRGLDKKPSAAKGASQPDPLGRLRALSKRSANSSAKPQPPRRQPIATNAMADPLFEWANRRIEHRDTGKPTSDEDLLEMFVLGKKGIDPRNVLGGEPGAKYWSQEPVLDRGVAPDDVELSRVSPLLRQDPETGLLFSEPPFASSGHPGINYADYAVGQGLAVPVYNGRVEWASPASRKALLRRALRRP